jgi:hypothetical protein
MEKEDQINLIITCVKTGKEKKAAREIQNLFNQIDTLQGVLNGAMARFVSYIEGEPTLKIVK